MQKRILVEMEFHQPW